MKVKETCENCRWGTLAYSERYSGWRYLCRKPENEHAGETVVQDGYCECYEPEKVCGTCRYCELATGELDGYSGQYVCRNEIFADEDEDGCMPVDPDYDEACDEWKAGDEV